MTEFVYAYCSVCRADRYWVFLEDGTMQCGGCKRVVGNAKHIGRWWVRRPMHVGA